MAETNTAALRAQGGCDARALSVTGLGRADTGRIRRAVLPAQPMPCSASFLAAGG